MNERRRQDALVREYLRRLGWSLRELRPDEREPLMAEISDHIATARGLLAAPTDDDVRGLLERLGSPEEISAEVAKQEALRWAGPIRYRPTVAQPLEVHVDEIERVPGGEGPHDPAVAPSPPPASTGPTSTAAFVAAAAIGDPELRAVNLLLAGGLLLGVGWVVGAVLLWRSKVFTLVDKVVGTLVLPGGVLPAVYVLFRPVDAPGTSLAHVVELAACMLLPLLTSTYLHRRLRAVKLRSGFESFRARRAAHAAERERNEMGLG